MSKYKLTNGSTINRLADNAFIPNDINNKDYVEYLKWLEEGNEPIPADPIQKLDGLTPEQKLANAGLNVDELKQLLGLQ